MNRCGSENGLDFVAGTRLIDNEGQVVAAADGTDPQIVVAGLPGGAVAEGPADYLSHLPSVTSVTAN